MRGTAYRANGLHGLASTYVLFYRISDHRNDRVHERRMSPAVIEFFQAMHDM